MSFNGYEVLTVMSPQVPTLMKGEVNDGQVKVTKIFCSFYVWSTVFNKVPTLAELSSSLYFKRSDKRAKRPMSRGL